MPVPAAEERSVTSSPVSHRSTQSLSPTHQLTAAHVAASWRANQRSFVSGVMGWTGTPVQPVQLVAPVGAQRAGLVGRGGVGPRHEGGPGPQRGVEPEQSVHGRGHRHPHHLGAVEAGRDTHSPSAEAPPRGGRRGPAPPSPAVEPASCARPRQWSATPAAHAEGHGLDAGGAHVEPDDDLAAVGGSARSRLARPLDGVDEGGDGGHEVLVVRELRVERGEHPGDRTRGRDGRERDEGSAAWTSVTVAPAAAEVTGPGGKHAGGTRRQRAGGAAAGAASAARGPAASAIRRPRSGRRWWASRGLPTGSGAARNSLGRPRARQPAGLPGVPPAVDPARQMASSIASATVFRPRLRPR